MGRRARQKRRNEAAAAIQQKANPYVNCTGDLVVGGGWGGIYSLYRRVLDDPERAATACLFEQASRLGGRTYSVTIDASSSSSSLPPLHLDLGSHRFAPDMHFLGDLILHHFKDEIKVECDAAECAPPHFPHPFPYTQPLHVIDGNGLASVLELMVRKCQALGVQVFLETQLTKWFRQRKSDGTVQFQLQFQHTQTNETAMVQHPTGTEDDDGDSLVLLNLPRHVLWNHVQGVRESLPPPIGQAVACAVADTPPDVFGPQLSEILTVQARESATYFGKAYLYYETAWWRTQLPKVVTGRWPPGVGFVPVTTPQGVPLNVQWDSGPVQCNDEQSCHGLLQIYFSISNETYFSSLSPSPWEPYGSVWANETDSPHFGKLATTHEALLESLQPLLDEHGVSPEAIPAPLGLLVAMWRRPSPDHPLGVGLTAPTKPLYHPDVSGDTVCGLTPAAYRETVLQPWLSDASGSSSVYVVNNDFAAIDARQFFGDWAEESLWQAERALHAAGMGPPPWLTQAAYYQEHVVKQLQPAQHHLSVTLQPPPGLPEPALLQGWVQRATEHVETFVASASPAVLVAGLGLIFAVAILLGALVSSLVMPSKKKKKKD